MDSVPVSMLESVAGGIAMGEDTRRIRGQAATRPRGSGWARVRRQINDVAGKTPGQIQQGWFRRGVALLRYHAEQSLNPAYRQLVADVGIDPADRSHAARMWSKVPVIDKHWLARAGYDRQPACPGRVLIMGTSGSTAAQVLVPVTARCANRGLGDNFLRA